MIHGMPCAGHPVFLHFSELFWRISLGKLFFADTRDTGMDFFRSIEYDRGRKPYEKFDTRYPPQASLLFDLLCLLVPGSISSYVRTCSLAQRTSIMPDLLLNEPKTLRVQARKGQHYDHQKQCVLGCAF